MLDIMSLIQHCSPGVDAHTMSALIEVESNANPYAIGVVGARLARQPVSYQEALATAQQLDREGWNFSIGLGQINRYYLNHHKISYDQAFQPCHNLQLSSKILQDCYLRAKKQITNSQTALRAALSCYYSGNFWRGFQSEDTAHTSYVQRVMTSAHKTVDVTHIVPPVQMDLLPQEELSTQLPSEPSDHAPVLLPFKPEHDTTVQLQLREPEDSAQPRDKQNLRTVVVF